MATDYDEGETLTLKQLYDEVANLSVLDIRYPVKRDGKNLVLTPEIAAMFAPDNLGRLRPLVNTSGEVTEASGAAIAAESTYLRVLTRYLLAQGYYGEVPLSPMVATQKRRFCVPLPEVGGAIAATEIVPALAGYTGHAEVQGVWCPTGGADPANTWTFVVAAGTIIGADVYTMNLTAARYHNFTAGVAGVYGPPAPMRGTIAADDNKAIMVEAALLANVGLTYYIDGVYWYET